MLAPPPAPAPPADVAPAIDTPPPTLDPASAAPPPPLAPPLAGAPEAPCVAVGLPVQPQSSARRQQAVLLLA